MLGWELPPHNSGGLGVACYHMARSLARAGASIDFVVPYKAVHPDTEFMAVYHTSQLDPLNKMGMGAYDPVIHTKKTTSLPKDIQAVQKKYVSYVKKHVATSPPDVIHAHDWLTLDAGVKAKQLSGAPLIAHIHATEFDRAGDKHGNLIIHEIEQVGLLTADRILAVSNLTKQLIIEKYNIPADKIEVVHNSIDEASASSVVYADSYAYIEKMRSEGYTIVSTLGRLTVQKGLPQFMRAAARACSKYDRFLFVIAGDGEQRDELVRLSADLGISDKVLFTGFVRGKAWRDVYAISDIFVMSSVSEPFGLTALEAAANDTSLIISNQSGVGEVLSSILRFDYWDETKLADQMINLASSQALRRELSRGVKNEFDRFSWDDVAEKCLRQYQHARMSV